LNPDSLKELSVQKRLIWLAEADTAERFPGPIGIVWGVVALAVFE
jgi:hypothetical protein